jgi:hypothetical protein
MALVEWEQRPQDVANLLNPAFDGFLLYHAIAGFQREAEDGMPFELAFLVLPLVLHEPTRSRLPSKVTTHLPTWLQDHRDVLLGLGDRIEDLVPYTQEAIRFLTAHELVTINEASHCLTGPDSYKRGIGPYSQSSDEIHQCIRAATSVGRWLALSGNTTTVFALLGIKP